MDQKDSLIQTLPPETRDDAERVYAEIGQTMPDPDLRDFVAELHRRGMLDPAQLRDAVMALEATRRIDRVSEHVESSEVSSHQILGPLGAGAMGEVLLAKDSLGRVVAVKRMLPGMEKRKAIARRFLKEAQVTAQLDHPSIIPIHAMVRSPDGSLAYAMKLVRGHTLEDYFQEAGEQWSKRGSTDLEHGLEARLERFLHVCDAIAYAHDRGVVHRDLKPENIMVGTFNQVIVMDWGIAKLIAVPDGNETLDAGIQSPKIQGTRIGMVMGTPRYMSPEQADGRNDVLDGRSDQYALGLILQELVTLQPAVKGDLDLEQCLTWARTGRRVPMTVLHRKQPLPKQLVAIVDKACQVDPAKRYRHVGAMAEDIRRYLRDEPIHARRDSIGDRLGRWVARNRGKMLVLVVLLMALGTAAVAATGMFGVTALGAAQYQAQVQEERLARILAAATDEAIHVEAAFLHWNGQINGLGYAAEQAVLAREWDGGVADPYVYPVDMKQSPRYQQEVSLTWPDLAIADGLIIDKEIIFLRQLRGLGQQMRSTLADSAGMLASGRPGAHRNAIEAGVPIVWASVYMNNGVRARFPGRPFPGRFGKDGTPASLIRDLRDFRGEPWFTSRALERSVSWEQPHVDSGGMGLVSTAYRSLAHGQTGDFIGLATIEVSMAYVQEHYLRPPEWAHSAYLVDKDGMVVLASDDKPAETRIYKPAPFSIPEVRARLGAERFGSMAVSSGGGRFQVTWARLDATGWYYVLLVEQGKGPPAP